MSPPDAQPPSGEERPTNRLAYETSAYLRQHMYNPVDWYPWGPEALERAAREDKPLLVSIGYSACHWCHVMEHESFEDPETAALMNRGFVSVKVDREERPDVDQIYMDVVTGLTGHGGWPLTVFCTPDGRPFYGGTYYPPEPRHGMPSFRQLLAGIAQAYHTRREEVEQSASKIVAALARRPDGVASAPPGVESARQAALRLLQAADPENGGFGRAPKFPTPPYLDLLMAAAESLPPHKASEALDHVIHSCRRMARGGVYDQFGGGFHRYSVDAHWGVPHFEKMLYDQGQLLRTYVEAWRRSGAEDLLWPVRETLAYLRRELTAPEGGYYASQDADSEGGEGSYYVWTPAQIEEVLGPERAREVCAAYGVTERGNFEGGASVPHAAEDRPRDELAAERELLRRARSRRPAPATDRKRVASWNALAISGLARAATLLPDPSLLDDAVAAADFAMRHMRDDRGRLLRVFNEGRAHVPAFLDDVAGMLEACLDLHRAGAGARFHAAALALAEDIVARFWDESQGDLFLTPSDGEPLIHRPRSDHDGATPHSTGLASLGLLRVATLTGRDDLQQLVTRIARSHAAALERAPESLPTLARAALLAERGLSVAVIAAPRGDPGGDALASRARRSLEPEDAVVVFDPADPPPEGIHPSWLAGRGVVEGRATAYVCRGVACSLPIMDPEAFAPLLHVSR